MKINNNKSIEEILKKYCYVFWDYDDTLSPTVISKGIAYAEIFKGYPKELKDFILKHHKKYPGVSREIKLPLYHKESLKYKGKYMNIKLEDLKIEFSLECIRILSNTPIFNKIDLFIRNNSKANYIITNMPQKEIDIVLELKSIKQFFKEVKGDSIYKSNTLKNLLAQIGNKGKCVFIGDSEGDYIAAKECNVDFILKTSSLNKNLQNIPKMKVI
tara:strand:+ start:5009 stop:5653 length:645 start_codon:yes stop_codon:yes gene_type:complete